VLYCCVVSPEKKRKKRNINNDLAVLPSHDNILKITAFTTSRASEMKVRAKEALSINLHSKKYI